MTSYVENETGVTLPFDMKDIVDKIMDAVTQMENCPYETTVNLLLVDNEGIREYNRNFRDIDKETDVLSFPNIPFEQPMSWAVLELEGRYYEVTEETIFKR